MNPRALLLSTSLLAVAGLPACGGDDGTTGDDQNAVEGPKLKYDDYKVLFTNPLCKLYPYGSDQHVVSTTGKALMAKPENVFCTQTDSAASAARPESPQNQLVKWIQDPATTEIFFTYLSFSNSVVTKELCTAITERDVKVTFVLDSMSDTIKADQVMACKPKSGNPERAPRFEKRGHEGGIGFAHNKIFMINPGASTMKIAFSSGNLSSGVVLHHENWHFITLPSDTYFAQAHLCAMNAELDHHASKKEYKEFMTSCRGAITQKEERDMKVWFSPAEGAAASKVLTTAIGKAKSIDIAAHRFSYTALRTALESRLEGSSPPKVRFVGDDDIWWAGKDQVVGDNNKGEWWNVKDLTDLGAQAHWMETNHGAHLLHHNKFVILSMPSGAGPSAVFGGAGNLTGTAFGENWENFYYITIPAAVTSFRKQYEHLFNDLATSPENMPSENILPPG